MIKEYFKAYISGFLATLIFHQGIIAVLYLNGVIPIKPFNMNSTPPFGVPAVVSLAFFGGIWGVFLWRLVRRDQGVRHWLMSIIFGAIGPTAVAFLIVFPLKGISVKLAMIPLGLVLNGAWGFGSSLLMRVFGEKPS